MVLMGAMVFAMEARVVARWAREEPEWGVPRKMTPRVRGRRGW
jgi:hypothetical protein